MAYNIQELAGEIAERIAAALEEAAPGLVTTTQRGFLAPDAEAIANGFIKIATSGNKGLMSKDFAALLESPEAIVFIAGKALTRTPGFHNSLYRGKYLGNTVTAAQWAQISAGTFDDMFIGDYWTIGGANWRIAAFDYWLHNGDTACETHHIVIMPDTNLLAGDGSTTHWMNATDTTEGGYIGSDFYTGNNGNTGKATILSQLNSAFGSGHLLTHREYLVNAVASGRPSGGAWYDSIVEIPNERMVYGNAPFSPVSDGSAIPSNYTIDNAQLPLFALDHSRICNRAHWWLRDPVSARDFAGVNANGNCASNGASGTWIGVRPAFGIRA